MNCNNCEHTAAPREGSPEPQVIQSQYRLQQLLEDEEPLLNIPPHVIAYYQSRGMILVSEEGGIVLATPYKGYNQKVLQEPTATHAATPTPTSTPSRLLDFELE